MTVGPVESQLVFWSVVGAAGCVGWWLSLVDSRDKSAHARERSDLWLDDAGMWDWPHNERRPHAAAAKEVTHG